MTREGEGESGRIARVYAAYEASGRRNRAWSVVNPGNRRIISELHNRIEVALRRVDAFPTSGSPLVDVGCGEGILLSWLMNRGAPPAALLGADLLEERVAAARTRVPGADLRVADARSLPFADASVRAVVLSTVLSSIVDHDNRARVAAEALRVVRPDGVVLCYDARLPNPINPNVRSISRRELAQLFPGCELSVVSLTLLPPLARRLGRTTNALYGPLLALRFLRSHLVAQIRPRPG
jgi:SAM-dependent methyltransferase